MNTFLLLLFILISFALIVKGGDIFVEGAVGISSCTGIPKAVIGATVVSLGTTLPEITVSLVSVVGGDTSLSLSNAVGSVICNTALIGGIALSFTGGKKVEGLKKKILLFAFSACLLTAFAVTGKFDIWKGILLLLLFVVFVAENILCGKREQSDGKICVGDRKNIAKNILCFCIGVASVVVGAKILVDCVSMLAIQVGVPTAVVGFTVVALGTSLPELVTAISAVKRNCAELTIGNVAGANVINTAFISGLCFVINGGKAFADSGRIIVGTLVMFACAVLFCIPILLRGRISRVQGVALIALYLAYTVCLAIGLL